MLYKQINNTRNFNNINKMSLLKRLINIKILEDKDYGRCNSFSSR